MKRNIATNAKRDEAHASTTPAALRRRDIATNTWPVDARELMVDDVNVGDTLMDEHGRTSTVVSKSDWQITLSSKNSRGEPVVLGNNGVRFYSIVRK